MYLTIILRKEVPDEATAQTIFEIVKSKIADNPDIEISGSINSKISALDD